MPRPKIEPVRTQAPKNIGPTQSGVHSEILRNSARPPSLINHWHERKENAGKPFPSFARWIARRGDIEASSDFAWTVDFAARRAQARVDMALHHAEAVKQREEVLRCKEQYGQLRRAGANVKSLQDCRDAQSRAEKALREAQAAADAIDAAVYDLKAVNPRAREERDSRTAEEILLSIAAYGSQVDDALAALRKHLSDAGASS